MQHQVIERLLPHSAGLLQTEWLEAELSDSDDPLLAMTALQLVQVREGER